MTAVEHRFGPYGGQFVPETLMPALAELEAAWLEARADAGFQADLARLLHDYAGRPTPLYEARRLSEAVGRPIYLKREDLLHTGAHKINNALGQALLAKRMGKTRIIAETGAGQHGVASATACALLGLECIVYMGTEDMRRQQPNVQRMGLLGATVEPVEAGARTLKEAVSAAIRDWVANVGDTHYIIGSSVGPAPFPALVRDLQRVIGDEARAQVLEQAGRLPERVIACVGGGSNAIGIFVPFVDDAEVQLIGVEAAGDGIETGPPRRAAHARRARRRPARRVLGDHAGRGRPDPRGALDLGRPRLPRHRPAARAPARHRPRDLRGDHRPPGARRVPDRGAARGHHPGARVLPRRRLGARRGPVRARPDLPLGPRRQGPRRGAVGAGRAVSTGIERIAAAFAATDGRAALMPYLMGGFPDLEASRAIGEAYADGGADLVELGVPFSDPLADGPVIHAAGTQALAAGVTVPAVIELARALSERLPVILMCYANLVLARGVERFADELAQAECQRSDHSGPPARGGAGGARGLRRGGDRARPAGRPDDPGGAAGAHRRAGPRLRLHGVGDRHHRRARGARRRPTCSRASRRHTEVPVALGFGISTPEQAAAAAAAGAEGVIVGSRLVRAAAEGEDVRALVEGLAAALARADA